MEEYAINFRNIIWLYPPADPTRAERVADIKIIVILLKIVSKIIGIIFCVVNSIVNVIHETPSETEGSHWKTGKHPIFVNIAIVVIMLDLFSSMSVLFIIIEKISIIDPMAWIIKYFNILSAVELLFLFIMIGINEIIFSSKDIHIVIHEDDVNKIIILRIFINNDNMIVGLIIKKMYSIDWV